MAEELTVGKAQVEITANTDGLTAGVENAKKSLSSLGAVVSDAGKAAKAEWERIRQESGKGTAELSRSVTRNISELERLGIEFQSGGRRTVEFYEAQLRLRGIPESVYKPLADSIRQVAAAQQKLAEEQRKSTEGQRLVESLRNQVAAIGKSSSELLAMRASMLGVTQEAAPLIAQLERSSQKMGALGLNARDTALQMRFIAPQVTDIVTSLLSGQAPFTVLIQQGGQLKDMFGGIGNTLRALGSYVAASVTPFTVLAAAAAALALAYKQGSDEATAYNRALILTGNSAGLTSGQLADMAVRLDAVGGTQRAAAAALAEMAGSTKIAGENIERFTEIALALERTTGQAIADTRKEFEELGKSPVDAITKLNEKYNFLTAEVYKQIRALEDQGQVQEAATAAQEAYANAMEGRTKQLQQNLGAVERGWKAIVSVAKEAWDAMLNIGREQGTATRLEAVSKQIEDIEAQLSRVANSSQIAPDRRRAVEASLASLRAEQALLEAQLSIERLTTEATREQNAAKDAGLRLAKAAAESADKEQKRQAEIARLQTDAVLARQRIGADQAAIEADLAKAIAAVNEKYKDRAKTSRESYEAERTYGTAYQKIVTDLLAAQSKFAGQTQVTSKAQEILNKALADGV